MHVIPDQLCVEGNGPGVIANILREEKIERPSVYLAKRGCGTHKDNADMSEPYCWKAVTVQSILSKPEYMGHTVNFRTYKDSYKDKQQKWRSKEDWAIFEHTHEAIIDAETWKLAQKLCAVKHRTDTVGEANPLTGLVLELAKRYTDFTELTTPMLNEFVEKIVVHAPDKSTGDRVQEVEIYLKFIGKLDLPEAEPTLEEQAKQGKEQARRAYYREKSKERYERKKRERAQIAAQS